MTITITQPSLFLALSFDAAIGQEIGRFWPGNVILPPFFSRRLDLPEFDSRNDTYRVRNILKYPKYFFRLLEKEYILKTLSNI